MAQHNIHLLGANQPRLLRGFLALAGLFLMAGCSAEKKAGPPPPLTPQQQNGQRLFSATCQACHETATNTIRQGPSLKNLFGKKSLPSGAPANDDRVRDAIMMGRPNMPGYQYVFTDEQIADLIAYLHSL